MSETLAIKLFSKGGTESEIELLKIGDFSEASPSDSAHTAQMNNSGSGWNTYFSYSGGTYTCTSECYCILVGWVSQYSTASYTKGEGQLYVNGSLQQSYKTPALSSGSTSGKFGVLHKFVVGNTFYFKTPNNNGYPKQFGELFKLTSAKYAEYEAMIASSSSVTISGYSTYSTPATMKTL